MKKLIALLLALVMVFGMVACGGAPETKETEAPAANETEAPAAEGGEVEVTDVTLKVWGPRKTRLTRTAG